jgi:hypothetical protein
LESQTTKTLLTCNYSPSGDEPEDIQLVLSSAIYMTPLTNFAAISTNNKTGMNMVCWTKKDNV